MSNQKRRTRALATAISLSDRNTRGEIVSAKLLKGFACGRCGGDMFVYAPGPPTWCTHCGARFRDPDTKEASDGKDEA